MSGDVSQRNVSVPKIYLCVPKEKDEMKRGRLKAGGCVVRRDDQETFEEKRMASNVN